MLRSKKGNFVDVPEFIYFALSFSILALISLLFINGFDDQIQLQNESVVLPEAKNASLGIRSNIDNGYDYLFLFGTMIFVIASIVFARVIPSSPKFVIVATFLLVLFPLLAMLVESVWDGFNQQTLVAGASSTMIFLPYVMDHLTIFVLLYTLAVAIALYTKDEVAG